jgi:LysM repeat protein
MGKTAGKLTLSLVLALASMAVGALFSYSGTPGGTPQDDMSLRAQQAEVTSSPSPQPTYSPEPSETIPPYTPLPTLTPSQTLKPPPTFEPPTQTPVPSLTPSTTPTPTTDVSVSVPGLNGAETPTPTTTPGCEPREDWQLTYTVQANDALAAIADRYGVWVDELAEGNCLTDKNLIVVGQELRVPGDAHPVEPEVECVPIELLTPFNGTLNVEGDGSLTVNWRGPLSPKNLIRIYRPDGSMFEQVVELRQNETIDMTEELPLGGTYTWYIYPLDSNFVQICPEGGPWTFTKAESEPTPTPVTSNAVSGTTGSGGVTLQ